MAKELTQGEQRKLFNADKETRKASDGLWPKYAMSFWNPEQGKENKQRKFLPFSEAAQLYDSGFVQVEFGIYVLSEDMSMRRMTDFDQHEISEAADEYSASK